MMVYQHLLVEIIKSREFHQISTILVSIHQDDYVLIKYDVILYFKHIWRD